jgi:hypothetical protein
MVAGLLKSSYKELEYQDEDSEGYDEHAPIVSRRYSNTPKYDRAGSHLTPDEWSHVFLFLEKEDVLQVSLTCRDMREAAGMYVNFLF